MVWTQEEQELIAILDNFIEQCSQSDRLKNINYHRLVRQILAKTKGEINATRKYCQEVLQNNPKITDDQPIDLENFLNKDFAQSEQYQTIPHVESVNSVIQSFSSLQKPQTQKFKSCWTVLFILFSLITIFFTAKKYPNINSSNNFSNIAIFCPVKLIETAQTGIINRDEALLIQAITDFKQLKEQQANQLGLECEQILWETQFVYAIDFLASQGQRKKAVKNLCEISVKFFQNKEVIPWFTRWSNTNQNFSQWLIKYKANNSCPVASYLE